MILFNPSPRRAVSQISLDAARSRTDMMGISVVPMAIVLLLALSLAACGGGQGASTTPVSAASPSVDPGNSTTGSTGAAGTTPASPAASSAASTAGVEDRRVAALSTWRENSPSLRPKGSCMGCHGADFFDLARIGSTRDTIVRRATTDGASAAEAANLAAAIEDARVTFGMPANDPRSFRPFQPGGEVLPGSTWQERDAAFGVQLTSLAPTLMGEPVTTLAQAQQARQELLDIAQGRNAGGANPERLNMRSLKVGIPFPLWSADAFNATDQDLGESTVNDWVSDLALEPTDQDRSAWLKLHDTYMADPNKDNFWNMFAFVDRLELYPKAHVAGLTDAQRGYLLEYAGTKYRTTLIGQHLLRAGSLGTTADFLGDKIVSFEYLLRDSHGVKIPDLSIPPQSHLWDVADVIGRQLFHGNFKTTYYEGADKLLAELGFPKFVQDSVTSVRGSGKAQGKGDMGQALRVAWFWMGATMDPSLQRLGVSHATKDGEYIFMTLESEDFKLFLHKAFLKTLHNVSRHLPEAGFQQSDSYNGHYTPKATEFYFGYYLVNPAGEMVHPDWVSDAQRPMLARIQANSMRMYVLLYTDAVQRGSADIIPADRFADTYAGIKLTLNAYANPADLPADMASLNKLKTMLGY